MKTWDECRQATLEIIKNAKVFSADELSDEIVNIYKRFFNELERIENHEAIESGTMIDEARRMRET